MKIRVCLGLAFLAVLPATLFAEVPLPPALQEAIRTISKASVFPIDGAQEIAFQQQHSQPPAKKKLTPEEKMGLYHQAIREKEAFVATQRKNETGLTGGQKDELIAILLDKENYYDGLFSVGENTLYAVDARSADSAFTMLFGSSLVRVYIAGEQQNALLNERGRERLLQWSKSVGMVSR